MTDDDALRGQHGDPIPFRLGGEVPDVLLVKQPPARQPGWSRFAVYLEAHDGIRRRLGEHIGWVDRKEPQPGSGGQVEYFIADPRWNDPTQLVPRAERRTFEALPGALVTLIRHHETYVAASLPDYDATVEELGGDPS